MSHANAALTPRARLRLARLIIEEGWPVAVAAKMFLVSPPTARKWAARYRAEGPAGMTDRTSRPHVMPTKTPPAVVKKIVKARWRRRLGPVQIAGRAIQAAKLGGYDVVLLDTAGRITLDEAMMAEAAEVKRAAAPHEVLLVADSLTGQDAVNLARSFDERVGLTGIVLTRVDGDGRGGAALSMRAVTGKPIKFAGVGEKMDALEAFQPSRVAGRILGMGDVVSLVERAAEAIQQEDAERMTARLAKGQFDMNDLRAQLSQMQRMGGLGALAGMLPGMKGAQKAMQSGAVDEKILLRMDAMITSMTAKERAKPELINAKRKIRIAKGSGTNVQEVNKLLKMHLEMQTAMKKIKKMGGMKGLLGMLGKGGLGGLGNALGGAELGDMMSKAGGPGGSLAGMPGLPGAKGLPGAGPGGLPGLPGGFKFKK